MTYYASRRDVYPHARDIDVATSHVDLGSFAELADARQALVNAMHIEATWLEVEADEHGGRWRADRARHLRWAAEETSQWNEHRVYRSVQVDGTRWGVVYVGERPLVD